MRRVGFVALTVCTAALILTLTGGPAASPNGRAPMVGTFKVTAGTCDPVTDVIAGSYFKLIFPGGNVHTGFFFQNTSSRCFDKSFTTISPGTEGGLVTGRFQPGPPRAFTEEGGARANAIIRPVSFAAIALSLSTQPMDTQTKKPVPAPAVQDNRGKLSGNVTAVSAAWRKIYFNQGSPKPGGRRPGLTRSLSGTYNVRTHSYTLNWTSKIVGGPFTGFIGQWHLVGTFVAAD